MNKIQKWLIHKLGGISELPKNEPNIVIKQISTIPVCSKIRITKGDCQNIDIDFYKEFLVDKIVKELSNNGMIDFEQVCVDENTIELRAKVRVMRGVE